MTTSMKTQNADMVMMMGGKIFIAIMLIIIFLFADTPRKELIPNSLKGMINMKKVGKLLPSA